MIKQADAWLIARIYQPIVDLVQRKPQWWVEQCAFAIVVTTILQRIFGHTSYVHVGFDVFFALVFVLTARTDYLFAELATMDIVRRWCMVTTGVCIPFILIPLPNTPYALNLLDLANLLPFASVYYFAACRPPKPREPKRRLVASPTS